MISHSTCDHLEERRSVQQSAVTAKTDYQVDAVGDIVITCGQAKTPRRSVCHSAEREEGFSTTTFFLQPLLQKYQENKNYPLEVYSNSMNLCIQQMKCNKMILAEFGCTIGN